MMSKRSNYSLLIVVILLITALFLKNNFHSSKDSIRKDSGKEVALNRNDNRIILTTHARCRMDCRQITKEEIKEILKNGKVNYKKSDLDGERGPDYALEGYTDEQQHLRVVFAPKDDGLVVVTCIDLDKEWNCNCN